MRGYKLIARVTKDLKMVDFYLSGGHHASCNPKKSKSTLTSNTYQHLSGRIKNFLKGEYVFFYMPIEGVSIASDNILALEQKAREIAAAKINPPKM
jgi:hypothetical protein